MRILITGITGMVGSHLAEYVLAHHPDAEVHGLVRWRSPRDNIRAIQDRVRLHEGELRDLHSLVRLLETVRPDWIFHLAAQSYVSASFTRTRRHAAHQRDRHHQPARSGAPDRPRPAHPHLQLVGGLRPGARRRGADPREQRVPPGEPVRGVEGRRGHDRAAVLPVLRHQDHPHADVHPHRPAPRRRVRRERVRQADRRGRGRSAAEPDQGRQPEQRAHLRRRRRRGARLLAAAREVHAGRGVQHRRRAHDDWSARCWTC